MKSIEIYRGGVSIEWELDPHTMGYKPRDPSEIKTICRRETLKPTGGVEDSIFNGREYVPTQEFKP